METSISANHSVDRALLAHGAILILLGLLSGFTPEFSEAPRTALSAHTIGTLQGTLLIALAAVWPALGRGWMATSARYCAYIGFYANWLGAQLAALWGAKQMMTVHGDLVPNPAPPWQENVVAVLLNLSILIIAMCVLMLLALWRSRVSQAAGSH